MNFSEMFNVGKQGLGVFTDVYGAYRTGQNYEAQTLAYKRNSLDEIQRKKDSWNIQENSKDQAEFGGQMAMDTYLWEGQQKLNSIESQLEDMSTQLLAQENIAYEQTLAVDETVGNMMSRNSIDAMKAEARLVASAAGTGTEGGTTAVATREARSVEQFDNAVLIGRAASQKLNINRRLSMERLSDKNKRAYVASQLGTVFSPHGAAAAWEKGYAQTYAGISPSLKEGYLSHDKHVANIESTWIDDVVTYGNILTQNGIYEEVGDFLKQKDEENANLAFFRELQNNGGV